uniref:Uncharacterized protein n=1 Tax=Arundo donax TaxID=35708 RepID=A0A0A9A533_ARUDO
MFRNLKILELTQPMVLSKSKFFRRKFIFLVNRKKRLK